MNIDKRAFMSLNKEDGFILFYQLQGKVADLENKLEVKEIYIKNVINKFAEILLADCSGSVGGSGSVGFVISATKECETQTDRQDQTVRSFPKITLIEENQNLVLGSSIIGKLENDKTIPIDCAIHAYRGSSTNENFKVLEECEPNHLKTLIIQDGTNNVLKHYNENAQDNFAEQASLFAKCIEKFSADVVVIYEVPPLKQNAANTAKNAKIDAFNKLIDDNYADKYKILSLNQAVKDEDNRAFTQGNDLGYNNLYFDNLHFNIRFCVPLLKTSC